MSLFRLQSLYPVEPSLATIMYLLMLFVANLESGDCEAIVPCRVCGVFMAFIHL